MSAQHGSNPSASSGTAGHYQHGASASGMNPAVDRWYHEQRAQGPWDPIAGMGGSSHKSHKSHKK